MSWRSFAKRNRSITLGIPFFVLIIGGSFGLKGFSQVRYDYRVQTPISREEVEEMGVKMKAKGDISIEKEFAKLQGMDIDTWENKRGPRPWESDEVNPTNKEMHARSKSQKL